MSYVKTLRVTRTKWKNRLDPKRTLSVVGDADTDGWLPVIVCGAFDWVRVEDVASVPLGL